MDGPETILYGTTLVSQSYPVTVEAFVHADTMSTPGAVKSGYAGKGKGLAESLAPLSAITVPAAPAKNAPVPLTNSSQRTILPFTKLGSNEFLVQNLHFSSKFNSMIKCHLPLLQLWTLKHDK
ncbi:hypothetical protein PVL29_016719 [Vitis rotundifolia]|uniref:Uncharacterized protein n=1 Tax=Vitis rotundifolia TaxID=103349 RepID=A0AA38Z8T2_VITRO|nr:hypothetical protein PVL29_016719 [Vitis rotundifolia]